MRVCTCVPVCLSVCVSTPLCPPAWQGFVGAAGTPPRERGSGASPHPRCRGSPGPRAAAPPPLPRCPPLPPCCPPLPAVAPAPLRETPAPLRETQQREAGEGRGDPAHVRLCAVLAPRGPTGPLHGHRTRFGKHGFIFTQVWSVALAGANADTHKRRENSAHRPRPRAQTHGRPVSPTQQRPPPKL